MTIESKATPDPVLGSSLCNIPLVIYAHLIAARSPTSLLPHGSSLNERPLLNLPPASPPLIRSYGVTQKPLSCVPSSPLTASCSLPACPRAAPPNSSSPPARALLCIGNSSPSSLASPPRGVEAAFWVRSRHPTGPESYPCTWSQRILYSRCAALGP